MKLFMNVAVALLVVAGVALGQAVEKAAMDSAETAPANRNAVDPEQAAQAEKDFEAGRKLYFQGEFARSADKLAAAVAANPTKSGYKLLLAKVHVRRGNPEEAGGLLRQILKDNPEHVEAGVALAELQLAAGEHKQVIATLQPLLKG